VNNWIAFILLYAVFNGFLQCAKKKALEKNTIFEVMFFYIVISFSLNIFKLNEAINLENKYIFMIFLKALILFFSWLAMLYVIEKMPASLYGVLNLSRIIFSVILSVMFLNEEITFMTLIGITIVIIGLFLVNRKNNNSEIAEYSKQSIVILLFACFLSSVSSILDKKIMIDISTNQMLFWCFLFLTLFSFLSLLCKNKKVNWTSLKKNYWIVLAALALTIGDRFLYAANEVEGSKVIIMTILKQLSAVVIILLGKIMFNEKRILRKLLCCALIVLGIVLTII